MLLELLRSDYARFEQRPGILHIIYRLLKYREFRLLCCFRILQWSNNSIVKKTLLFALYLYYYHLCSKCHIELSLKTNLGEGVLFPHGGSIIINSKSVIGRNATIFPQVLIGSVKGKGTPFIGNNVFIGAGAKILGNVKVGDYSFICPNTVVVKDVEPYSVVAGIPAKVINMNGKKNVEMYFS